ncbi:type III secretion apparatus protein SctQ (plasmid) [Mycetohabitans rhizoxinica HKI 454]|uniref:Type III secretion apparatus protein SctQ n=2 Tax=Mycetohabitans rhizoxinica TaxID=412963 RepID=E5AVI7_MYCRK|nr:MULTISPECIES: type III secretion system cytoplasmic ring protein SctQ [Mycetohabitans]MCG1047054.1 type III secretion system cytoplasmic ring protein SctQ [Mycetohabitans sp. B6]CBK52141.1 type III secretion apparatus protein SctQ [Mycetohabitans rhizoxinica HKI 454]CBW77112.1 type III secretion apparatus protein SctQ [Mycetohabitans rhizoxinica HKI 454]
MIDPTVDLLPSDVGDARWRPRPLQPAVARAARLFCDNRLPDTLARLCGIEQWTVTLESSSAPAMDLVGAARWTEPAWLEFAHPSGRLGIGFDLAHYPALELVTGTEDVSNSDRPHGDPALQLAIAHILVQPVLSALAAIGLKELRLAGLYRVHQHSGLPIRPSVDMPIARMTFVHHGRTHAVTVVPDAPLLQLIQHCLDQHATSAAQRPSPDSGHPLAEVRVPGRLIIGYKTLTVSTLDRLAPGDVILRAVSANAGPLIAGHHAPVHTTVAWGTPGLIRLHAQAEIGGQTLSILKDPYMTEHVDKSLANDTLTAEARDEAACIDQLELPIQLEIDTIALPLHEICALRAGYVLELPNPVDAVQIKLVTHGRTIGYAELVSVGDHLGIRILQMVQGNAPAQ